MHLIQYYRKNFILLSIMHLFLMYSIVLAIIWINYKW